MRRQLLIAQFMGMPWAMEAQRLQTMAAVLGRWSSGMQAASETLASVRADHAAIEARRGDAQRAGGGAIAVLPLYGIVAQRASMVDDVSGPGGTSTQRFTLALREAIADDTIGGILIDIDSPGGSVYGVGELADEIYQARKSKPIFAFANSLAASAAYWIGASASEFYITSGGEVGSIGVYAVHEDYSAALEADGIKVTLVKAGKYKAEGNSAEPLSPDARDYMQSRIDSYYSAFVRGVARGRGVGVDHVRDGMGQGRVLGAQDAKAANMVNDVDTFDGVVSRLAKQVRANAGAKSGARSMNNASRLLDLAAR